MKFKQVSQGPHYRTADIVLRQSEDDAIDPEALQRIFDISFSSEEPVRRWFGWEVLDHGDGNVDLGRLNDGAPLLLQHDQSNPDFHVGTVESGRVNDGVGRARVRFASDGVSMQADNAVKKVNDGILTKVSVGYELLNGWETGEERDGEPVIRFSWRPMEISLVSVPADSTVGVFRSNDDSESFIKIEERQVDNDITDTTVSGEVTHIEAPAQVEPVDVQAEIDRYSADNTKRIENIQAIAKRHRDKDQVQKLADECIVEGTSLEDFQGRLIPMLETQSDLNTVGTDNRAVIGLDPKELERYSISRMIEAQATKDWTSAGFERECSDYLAEQFGTPPRGAYIPMDILAKVSRQIIVDRYERYRAMGLYHRAPPMDTVGSGDLVGTEHMASMFIESLRPLNVLMQAGARTLPGLIQNVSIPAFASPSPTEHLAEDADATDVEVPTRSVTLSPKTIASSVPYTRRLQKQSLPQIDSILLQDMTLSIANGIDNAGLNGAINGPAGIKNETGVQTVDTSAGAGGTTWANIVEYETKVSEQNADGPGNVYITTVGERGHLKTTEKATGYPVYLQEGMEVNGYPALATNQLSSPEVILYGDYTQVLMGFWGTLDVLFDWATKAASGGMVLRLFQDYDVAVRHGVSFAKSNAVA